MINNKKVIERENASIANNEAKFEVKELNIIQEETTQMEITRIENIIGKIELESIEEEMQITVESSSQEEKKRKEEGKIIQREEANIADTKETNRDMMEIENKKEEYEQAKFIVEEDLEEKTNNTTQGIFKKEVTSQEERIKRENQAAKELEEVFK